jgi:chemotaxis protein methyltransferase WspC
MTPSLYIEKMLTDTLGLDLASMGKGFLERTLERLLKKSGFPSLEDYVARLKVSPEEKEKIIEAAVVPETWFFRDHGPFAYLKNYLREEGKQKTRKEKIRILSVPCSTGEEPYSIVMTLLEAGMTPEEFAVDAVDLSENALKIARRGRYGKGSFRGVTEEMGRSYFHQEGSEVRISEQVLSGVRFYRDNLLQPTSMAQMPTYQVIFCRNLLIYLHAKAKDTAFSQIDRLLRPGGALIAGHAEVLFWRQRGYVLVDHPRSFALRKPGGKEERISIPSPSPVPGKREAHPQREAERRESLGTVGVPQAHKAPPEDFKKHGQSGEDGQITGASDVPTDLMNRARSLADRGKMEEALSLCRSSLAKDQPCAEVYYLMGLIHESRERVGEAEECYLKALYLDPDHFETLIHAGLMYERRHDHEKAALLKKRVTRIEGQRHDNGN